METPTPIALIGWFSRVLALLLSLGSLSCASDGTKEPAPDSGRICGLHDGRSFSVGAVFSDGCGCCNCSADGAVCYGGNTCVQFVDGGFQSLMSIPPCQSDENCSNAVGSEAFCVFDQGCSPGQGRCVLATSNACATFTSEIAHDYCGCDGQSFRVGVSGAKNYPDRPYAYVGACL
jgi:hypothetical protein